MQGYNLVVAYSTDFQKVLMCLRQKEPYTGLYNFVGGKIEIGEDHLDAAYRELFEETSITRDDISLKNLMSFSYPLSKCYVEVYVGRLNKAVEVFGEENPLFWMPTDDDFFAITKYAGAGNIGHIFEQIKFYKNYLFG